MVSSSLCVRGIDRDDMVSSVPEPALTMNNPRKQGLQLNKAVQQILFTESRVILPFTMSNLFTFAGFSRVD